MRDRVHLAANNPDLGGGEQMLLRHAQALKELGHPVTVVAPDSPTEVLDAAAGLGADVVAIRAADRRAYVTRLRAWDRAQRTGLLWCHGLLPAFATSGHANRIIHLHQAPRSTAQDLASRLARRGARATLVPSTDQATSLSGARAHPNWTADLPRLGLDPLRNAGVVGFVGRLSTDKGVDVLAQALELVPGEPRLVLAGDTRYVSAEAVDIVDAALNHLGERVERLGHVPPAQLFARVHVVVFPSVWAEPFGLVVAEAMAAGMPFVITEAGALPEVAGVDHPWVARTGDAADLARVIEQALTASRDELSVVADRARSRWQEKYSPDAGRRRLQTLLEDLGVR